MSNIRAGISLQLFIAGLSIAILASATLSTVIDRYTVTQMIDSINVPQREPEQSGYISIPATTFNIYSSSYIASLSNVSWSDNNEETWPVEFFEPVHLPHGATVTNVTFYWYDVDAKLDMSCQLVCIRSDGYRTFMAEGSSFGSSGDGTTFEGLIKASVIDNSQSSYIIRFIIPYNYYITLKFRYAIIGFEYPT